MTAAGRRPEEEARPLVSVIVPAYNAETTLPATIASVRSQSYQNLEIILIDDGSQDATPDIMARAASNDSRVKVLKQLNAGVASARNAGLAVASGEWIATIDADDLWHPDKIAAQISVALNSPLRPLMIYCWSRRIDRSGAVVADQGRPRHRGDVFRQLLAFYFINNASVVLLRRDAFDRVGGFDVELQRAGAQGAEDVKLYLAAAELGMADVAAGFFVGYRIGGETMSSVATRMRGSIERVLEDIERRRPELSPRLLALSRNSYDLYAASLALRAGDWRQGLRFVASATRRRAALSAIFFLCAALWRVAEQRALRRGAPKFEELAPEAASHRQPLMEWFARLRSQAVARTAPGRRGQDDPEAPPEPSSDPSPSPDQPDRRRRRTGVELRRNVG